MKRLPIVLKVLVFLVCFSFMLSAYNSGSILNENLIIPYVESAPVLDGDMDAEWTFPPVGLLYYELFDTAAPPPNEDHVAFYKAAYNDDGFYFWAHVTDDTVARDGSTADYENDCFELYFDGDDSDSAQYGDGNDVQWRWVFGNTGAGTPGGGQPTCPNATAAWDSTATGYTFELIIPDEDLVFTPAAGLEIGFEVQCADNDNSGTPATGTREDIIKWWNLDGTSWQHPYLFGNAMLGEQNPLDDEEIGDFVVEMASPPVIDAQNTGGEWDDVPEVKMLVYENYTIGDDEGFKDHLAVFRAGWDDDGFYLLGKVTDDTVARDGSTADYENDCFEIYFDGDNSDSAQYGDGNDVQWRWVYGNTGAGTPGGGQPTCPNATAAWDSTAAGYTFELSIPASDLVFTPAAGLEIGFEVQCSDNDNSGTPATGTRECIAKWWNIDATSWQHPYLFGTVELSTASTAPGWPEVAGVEEEVAAAGISLSVPTVIASGNLVVSGSAGKVSLLNLAGQVVKSAAINASDVSLDVSDLANGVYLVNLNNGAGSATKKVLLIK